MQTLEQELFVAFSGMSDEAKYELVSFAVEMARRLPAPRSRLRLVSGGQPTARQVLPDPN